MAARLGNALFWLGMLVIANGTMMPGCLAGDSTAVPDICKGHMSIHYMAAIKSTSDALDDRWSCAFEPESAVGKKVLRVCDEYGDSAEHGCWIMGTFMVDKWGARILTGVLEVHKLADTGEGPVQ
jgi:hypothetical protein